VGLFKKVKVWWKTHVLPGLNGCVEELEEQLKDMVVIQKQSDALITELEKKVREQIIENESRKLMLRGHLITLKEKMNRETLEGRLSRWR
jgi:hypothetical protein